MRTAVALLLLALLPATAGAGGVPVLPAGAAMEVERAAHTATPLADGRVLVTGGFRPGEVTLASAELYDPQTRTFSPTGQMTSVRSGHTATLLRNGRVLIAGGFDDEDPVRTAELYDPATGSFERTGSLTAPRGGATATCFATDACWSRAATTATAASRAPISTTRPPAASRGRDRCERRAQRTRRRDCATGACS